MGTGPERVFSVNHEHVNLQDYIKDINTFYTYIDLCLLMADGHTYAILQLSTCTRMCKPVKVLNRKFKAKADLY